MATSLTTLNDLLIKKLIDAIEKNNLDDAQKLAHIYSMLPE